MSIFIEGTAFPIGEKNVNGWGIPESEVDNAISSLKSSVVRICSRDSPHGCDESEDPKAEIGNIVAAWRDGNLVKTRALITDSTASQKISDKTWKNTWSIYGKAPKVVDGWPIDYKNRSITLVQNPAWGDATWEVAASESGEFGFRTFSEFTLIASQNKEGDFITEELEKKITELSAAKKTCEEQLKEMTVKMDEMDKSSSMQASTIEELKASNEKLTKELGEKTTLVASLEKEKAGSLPMNVIEEKIAAAIAEHDEKKTLSAARAKFVAARKAAHNIDTKDTEFTALSASEFEALAAEQGVKLEAGGPGSGPNPQYPAEPSTKTGFTVGRPDTKKPGEWRND